MFCLDYWHGWTAAERLYLFDYFKSGTRARVLLAATGHYTLLQGVDAKGQMRLVTGDEIAQVAGPDGKPYRQPSVWSNRNVGGLAELADAEVSKTSESNLISVRFRYPPPSSAFPRISMQKIPQGEHSGTSLIL